MTTTAEYQWALPVFEDTQSLFIAASGQATTTVPWDTTTDVLGGLYGVRVVAQSDDEQRVALTTVSVHDSANFVAYPLTGIVPLTVTFSDLSTPLRGIDVWLWDFGDAATSALQNPTHVYTKPGTYDITLSVTAGSESYTKTRAVYIVAGAQNQPPTVSAGGPYSVEEGGSVVVTASGADPKNAQLAHAWDLDNDGAFETQGQRATFSAAGRQAPSSYTIVTQVIDDSGLLAADQTTVTVTRQSRLCRGIVLRLCDVLSLARRNQVIDLRAE